MEQTKRFNNLTSEINAAYHEAARKLGLSDSAMSILYTICLNGDSCSLSDIVTLSGISKQTINSALRKLEKSGVAETRGGKKKQVHLTEAGKALAQNSALRILNIENEIFDSWPSAEFERYIALTEKYLSAFKEKIKELSTSGEQRYDSAI